MKSNNLFVTSMTFLCVLGGLCPVFLSNVSISTLAVLLVISVVFVLFAFYAYGYLRPLGITKIAACIFSLLSCSVTLCIGAKLLIAAKVLDKSYLMFVLLLGTITAAFFAVSKISAIKSVSLIFSVLVLSALILSLVLCLLDTDFLPPDTGNIDLKMLALLSILAISDIVVIFPISKSKSPLPFIVGTLCAFAVTGAFVTCALCVLSPAVYRAQDTPLLALLQSAYIASFVNRFEIVSVSILQISCVIKSGLTLAAAVRFVPRKYTAFIPIFVFVTALLVSFL